MIARLRRRHLQVQGVLAILVAVGVILALSLRKEIPAGPVAAPLDAFRPSEGQTLWESRAVFSELPSLVRLLEAAGRFSVEITPERDPLLPDLLLYWSPIDRSAVLPTGAHFLGRLSGTQTRRFHLPGSPAGSLYLFSLGHQRMVSQGTVGAR